jgi:hypothetical protein
MQSRKRMMMSEGAFMCGLDSEHYRSLCPEFKCGF